VSDRLNDLRRQRTLQKEHLDWLDREIAALEGNAPRASPAPPPYLPVSAPADDRDAEAILQEYRQPSTSIEQRTKMGCILYFMIAIAVLAVVLVGGYLLTRGRLRH
jgi:hypothetical protein